ncbi:MAG TPA: hypothetical protein VGM63_01065, partial [Mucilaginibacter sp.]|jgi:hypothetical protein
MPNIKFSYLYRDSANYKKFDWVIFNNASFISIKELETFIRSKLIYGEWFYGDQLKLPELLLDTFNFRIDPTWHEFESVELTTDLPTSALSLVEFIALVNSLR